MKRMSWLSLILLLVALACIGCSKDSSKDSKIKTSDNVKPRDNKDSSKDSKIKMSDYVKPGDGFIDPDSDEDIFGLLDLSSFLKDQGAVAMGKHVWKSGYLDCLRINARFPNKTLVTFVFTIDRGNSSVASLDMLLISAAEEWYPLSGEAGEDVSLGRSDWVRGVYPSDVSAARKYYEKYGYGPKYIVSPDEVFYGETVDTNTRYLLEVPAQIEDIFNDTVMPYLNLEENWLVEDPLKNAGLDGIVE